MGILKQGVVLAVTVLVYTQISRLFQKRLPPRFGGSTHPDFQHVADVFRANVESGKEPGGALAVYYKGELVVNLWGGYADVGSERPWSEDTVTLGFSCTKGIAAIVAAKLVEKGDLDYSKPVAHYWPAFAENGKDNVTVEMLLSHQAGLVTLDEQISLRQMKEDPDTVTAILARQKPVWPPGTQFGYHALSFGLYVDRLLQMADTQGRDTETIFQEEIAKPLDIDFHMHLPLRDYHRAARLESRSLARLLWDALVTAPRYLTPIYQIIADPNSLMAKCMTPVQEFSATSHVLNDPHNRDVTVSSISGTGTARGLAKIYGTLANGGTIEGKQMLSRELVERLSTVVITGEDAVFITGDTSCIGPGTIFHKNRLGELTVGHTGHGEYDFTFTLPQGELMVGHTGHGGQVAIGDYKRRLGIGYLTNHLTIHGIADDARYVDLEIALYKCLEKTKL